MSEEMKVNSKLNKKIMIVAAAVIVAALALVLAITVPKRAEAKRLAEQLDLGEKYLSELDYEQAIAAYLKAIEIDPKCEDAYLALADIYIATGEFDKAEEILKKAEKELGGATEKIREKLKEVEAAKQAAEVTPEPTPAATNTPEPTPTNTPIPTDTPMPTPVSTPTLEPTDAPTPTSAPEPTATNLPTSEPEDTPTPVSTPEPTPTNTPDAEQIQVTVRKTDIQADSVFNTEGYGSLRIQSVGDHYVETDNGYTYNDAFIPPQSALVDADGNMLFPYQYTYQRYRVSDGTVSLTEDSPYMRSFNPGFQRLDIGSPIYYRLDGSIVFDTASGNNQIDETTEERFLWYGGPVQDGYALVIKEVGAYSAEYHSYIMDQNGVITCVLPDEYNRNMGGGGDDLTWTFETQYLLGWCGEGLFAFFGYSYDEDWNVSGEAKGYMDSAGDTVLDLSGSGFTILWPFHEGLAAVKSESGKIGFIDKTGALVIPCTYESLGTVGFAGFSEDSICAVKKDGKWGYIGRDGNVVIPFEYDGAYGAGGGLASVVKDGKCGLVDYSNRVIVPLEYDDISSGEGGTAYAIKDGVLYIISKLK